MNLIFKIFRLIKKIINMAIEIITGFKSSSREQLDKRSGAYDSVASALTALGTNDRVMGMPVYIIENPTTIFKEDFITRVEGDGGTIESEGCIDLSGFNFLWKDDSGNYIGGDVKTYHFDGGIEDENLVNIYNLTDNYFPSSLNGKLTDSILHYQELGSGQKVLEVEAGYLYLKWDSSNGTTGDPGLFIWKDSDYIGGFSIDNEQPNNDLTLFHNDGGTIKFGGNIEDDVLIVNVNAINGGIDVKGNLNLSSPSLPEISFTDSIELLTGTIRYSGTAEHFEFSDDLYCLDKIGTFGEIKTDKFVLGYNRSKTQFLIDNLTSDRTLQLPDADGTVALTSDLFSGNYNDLANKPNILSITAIASNNYRVDSTVQFDNSVQFSGGLISNTHINSKGNIFLSGITGDFVSRDGSVGYTGSYEAGSNTITVKNGIITDVSPTP
jgi:hypothetical protein